MKGCCPKLPIAFIIVFAVGAFLYYQYSFTSTAKIDFSKDSFYVVVENGVSLFAPDNSRYKICFYSSFVQEHLEFLEKNVGAIPLLAVDFYQQRNFSTQNIKEIRIASALMLQLIHTFNIKALPQCYVIKQDSKYPMQYRHLKDFGFYKVINFKENVKEQ